MVDYPDQPDYQQAVTPGLTRWAPGTQFGTLAWDGDVVAGDTHDILFTVPNNGYQYVIDTTFIYTMCVGMVPCSMWYCPDTADPVWVVLAAIEDETAVKFNPFVFQSMVLAYPQGLKWMVSNQNAVTRHVYVYATMYRYLASM